MLKFAYTMIFLSGFTGLLYQVTWQKYLAIYLGSHALASCLVLASFFGFMALGYYLVGRSSHRLLKNKLLLYGIVEALIGAYALVSPQFFYSLYDGFAGIATEPGLGRLMLYLAMSSLFIGFPSFLMGGTIPILTQGLANSFQGSHRLHAMVYGLNTFGAFAGTLITGFILIEAFGLGMTLTLGAFLNLAIGLACWLVTKWKPHEFLGLEAKSETSQDTGVSPKVKWALYGISFLSGFYVFSIENIIIRMAGVALGSSTYTYTIVVSSFILAIALGSFLVSRFEHLEKRSLLLWTQSALFLSCWLLYLSIPEWPYWLNRIRAMVHPSLVNFDVYWGLITLGLLGLLILPVALMGMNLPLLFNFLRDQKMYLNKAVGQIYGINAIGSVLGTLIGGYILFDHFEGPTVYKVSLCAIVLTFGLLSLIATKAWSLSLGGVFLLAGLMAPAWPLEKLIPGRFNMSLPPNDQESYSEHIQREAGSSGKILFHHYGVNMLTAVTQVESGDKVLFVNAKPDASTGGDHQVRALNVLIPLSVAKKIEDVFIVGLGTSLSTGITTSFQEVQNVEVAEISQGVIESMSQFDDYNLDLQSRKNKFKIINDDAYSVLRHGQKKYDLIVSEPSNPWVAGVEKLFSIEFLQQATQRLKPDGLYSQWFPLHSVDPGSLTMILNNYNKVFPWTSLWATGGTALLILASNRPLELDETLLKARFEEQAKIYKDLGFHHHHSILGRQIFSPLMMRGMSLQAKSFHSLEHPVLAFRAGRANFANMTSHLENFAISRIHKPIVSTAPAAKLLYQQLNTPPPIQFFDDNIAYMKSSGMNLAKSGFYFQYANLQSGRFQKSKREPKALSRLRYLLGQKKSPALDKKTSSENLKILLTDYRRLLAMQKAPDWRRLLRYAPESCKDTQCFALIESLLAIAKGTRPADPIRRPETWRQELIEGYKNLLQEEKAAL